LFSDDFSYTEIARISKEEILKDIHRCKIIKYGLSNKESKSEIISVNILPQPLFSKRYDALAEHLYEHFQKGYKLFFVSTNKNQYKRLSQIIDDTLSQKNITLDHPIIELLNAEINEGFIDNDNHYAFYTEHQVFFKYLMFCIKSIKPKKAMPLLH
jgi:transcription-repair coupling factor (superfamily II helicase)